MKEQVIWKNKIVTVDYELNPWEFRGHFANSPGVRFIFKWNEVKETKNKNKRGGINGR